MKVLIIAPPQEHHRFKEMMETATIVLAASIPAERLFDIDLLVDFTTDRKQFDRLKLLQVPNVLVNYVEGTLAELPANFSRFNGWAGFWDWKRVEVVAAAAHRMVINAFFELLGKVPYYIKDIPGMITPRIVASVINEAYYTAEEGISTKEEIDTAMKLGTNYPYGPFEWAEKIGVNNVYTLLLTLSKEEKRFYPSQFFLK